MKNKELIKQIKKMVIDLEYDRSGGYKALAKRMGIHNNTLSMALTGYRTSKRSQEIILKLYDTLLADQAEMARSAILE